MHDRLEFDRHRPQHAVGFARSADLLIEGVDLAVTGLVRVIDPCGLGPRCTATGGKTCNQSDTHKGAQRCGEGRGLKHGINPENA